jgi:hypothetical protein
MAEKSSWDQANKNKGQKLGLVWRNRKKISQIIEDYFYLPFFLLIIVCITLTIPGRDSFTCRHSFFSTAWDSPHILRLHIIAVSFLIADALYGFYVHALYTVQCKYLPFQCEDLSTVHTGTLPKVSCLVAKVFTESIQLRRDVLMFFLFRG